MNKYDHVLRSIDEIDNNEISDTEFIVNQMVESVIYIFKEANDLIIENKTTFVFPLLRQAYEYILLIAALHERLMSISDFIYQKKQSGEYKNIIEQATRAILNHALIKKGKAKRDLINIFFRTIKEGLNNHTHASFPRLIRFMFETHNRESANTIASKDAEFIYKLIEMMFIPVINSKFNLNLSTDEYKQLIKDFPGFDIILIKDSMPKKYERLIKIDYVKNRLEKESKELKEDINHYLENKDEITEYFSNQKEKE